MAAKKKKKKKKRSRRRTRRHNRGLDELRQAIVALAWSPDQQFGAKGVIFVSYGILRAQHPVLNRLARNTLRCRIEKLNEDGEIRIPGRFERKHGTQGRRWWIEILSPTLRAHLRPGSIADGPDECGKGRSDAEWLSFVESQDGLPPFDPDGTRASRDG